MKDKKKEQETYCEICGGRTGFGFGVEPNRYDTICCSSKCATIIHDLPHNKEEAKRKYGITFSKDFVARSYEHLVKQS